MSNKGTWTPPDPNAAEAPPPIVGKIETARPEKPPVNMPTPEARWEPVAVDHVTRKKDGQDVACTVVMLRNAVDGELKSWESRGTFTLEQLRNER